MANDPNTEPEHYEESRKEYGIWEADISPSEEFLAEHAFAPDSDPDAARRWGNFLLKILREKRDAL